MDEKRTAPDAQAAQACRMRADMYGFLARLLRVEVDAELLADLRARTSRADTGDERLDGGYARIAGYLAGAGETVLTELAVDYVRTFIGAGTSGHSAAYPFESVYASEKHLLMQDARDEVLAIYRSEGMERADTWKVGEDHVALEFEFMQTLATRSAEALEAGEYSEAARTLAVQRGFFDDHIASWVPSMTGEMRRFAKTDFYLGLADVIDGFLGIEDEVLADLVEGV